MCLNSVYEFNIYGTNGQYAIVGKAKTKAGKNLVRQVVARVRETVSAFPGRFPGKVITVVYCMKANPEAVEEARSQDIWLFESVRERTPFPS